MHIRAYYARPPESCHCHHCRNIKNLEIPRSLKGIYDDIPVLSCHQQICILTILNIYKTILIQSKYISGQAMTSDNWMTDICHQLDLSHIHIEWASEYTYQISKYIYSRICLGAAYTATNESLVKDRIPARVRMLRVRVRA